MYPPFGANGVWFGSIAEMAIKCPLNVAFIPIVSASVICVEMRMLSIIVSQKSFDASADLKSELASFH